MKNLATQALIILLCCCILQFCILVQSGDGLLNKAETCSRLSYIKIIAEFDVSKYRFIVN